MYKKSGENENTIYFDCFNEPTCTAGARFHKRTERVDHLGTHSDDKPNENIIMRIQFEAFLKKQARSTQHANQSVLNLYKAALAGNFKGIWLPNDHKASFLGKLRRIRKYEVKEKPRNQKIVRQNRAIMIDASTSPMSPNNITRAIAVPTTIPSLRSTRKSTRNIVPSVSSPTSPYMPVATSSRVLTPNIRSAVQSQSNGHQISARVSPPKEFLGMANVSSWKLLFLSLSFALVERFFS